MAELYKYIQIDEHDDFYLAFDVEEREKEYKALVAEKDKLIKELAAEIERVRNVCRMGWKDAYDQAEAKAKAREAKILETMAPSEDDWETYRKMNLDRAKEKSS